MSQESSRFRIEVSGEIDKEWAGWLGLTSIRYDTNEEGQRVSLLSCCPPDESGFRGIMAKLWDLNLEVLSVVRLPREGGQGYEKRKRTGSQA